MKVTAASALPVLAFLPGGAIAGLLDKRGLECNTIYGEGKVAVKNLPTNVQVQGGKTVEKTVKSRKTVYITPTVTRILTGVTVVTDRVTQTKTGKPTTVTITGSSTSTVPALAGFTPAAAALPSAQAKVAHKYYHAKRDASATPAAASAAAPKVAAAKVAVSVNCVKIAAGVTTVTRTVAQKPYVTKYGRPETRTVNRQRTRHVEKIVATITIHKKSVVELPRATHWAACQNDNLLSWTWGKGGAGVSSNSTFGGSNGTSSSHVGISSVVLVAGTSAKSFDTSTATQCCIKCQTTPGCVGSQWRSGVCNIHIRPAAFATCSAHSSFSLGSFFANPLSFLGDGEGLILSNGRCGGTWKYGGLTS